MLRFHKHFVSKVKRGFSQTRFQWTSVSEFSRAQVIEPLICLSESFGLAGYRAIFCVLVLLGLPTHLVFFLMCEIYEEAP